MALQSSQRRVKKGLAPTPPRRTVSAIKEHEESVDSELKSRMKLQKAKIESNVLPEYPFESNNFANTKDLSEFISAPRIPQQQPPNQKSFQRGDNSKEGAGGRTSAMEDSVISRGTGSSDSLKHLAIDKSKYLINTDKATRSSSESAASPRLAQGTNPRDSGRKFSYPMIKQEYKPANDFSGSNSVDIGTSTMDDLGVQVMSTSFRGSSKYPKVPLPLPQSASLRHKKRSERPRLNTSHSMEADGDDSVTVGKLDVNNVAQTINRYGTIPKGVRIGEYLASMQSDSSHHHRELETVEDHDSGTDSASVSSCPALHPNGLQSGLAGATTTELAAIQGKLGSKGAKKDSEVGITLESNVRPSAVVKSQSSHVIVDNPKAQYSGLQRQKSDLIPGAKPSHSEGRESPLHGDSRPKPSPRFSRLFLDQTENVLKLEDLDTHSQTLPDRPSASPKLSHTQKGLKDSFSPSSTESTVVSSPDSVFDSRPRSAMEHKVPLRPPYQQKPRGGSASDDMQRDLNQVGTVEADINASVLSKVAKFQPTIGSEFSSFRTFQRGDGGRESFRDDKLAKVLPDIPIKPVGKDDKPIISGLKPVGAGTPTSSKPDNVNNGENSDEGNQIPVTKETIVSASERLKSCIDSLSTAGNKSSVNFMELVEEMQLFYDQCSIFIDSLQPHAKFHTKELLTRLQSHQQTLKTFSSSTPSGGTKLLADIQSVNKEILDVIQR